MALHPIFQEAPRSFGADDFTFRVRSGAQVNGLPVGLDAFRFTTGDPLVAQDLADAYGGTPKEWETKSEEVWEVYSEAGSLDLIFETILSGFKQFGRNNQIVRECNGGSDDCFCIQQGWSKKEWKQAAKQGTACEPEVKLTFRLADNPDIGLGRFRSGADSLFAGDPHWLEGKMEDGRVWQPPISTIEGQLADHGGRATGTLEIVKVSYKVNKGTPAEKTNTYSKPFVTITGPVHEAVEALLPA